MSCRWMQSIRRLTRAHGVLGAATEGSPLVQELVDISVADTAVSDGDSNISGGNGLALESGFLDLEGRFSCCVADVRHAAVEMKVRIRFNLAIIHKILEVVR